MIDHIELRTRDLPQSVRFYAAVLEPLGYRHSVDGTAKGFGDAHRPPDFFLVEGEPADHAHYAFRAPSRAAVRACYERGSPFNALDRAPALRRRCIRTTTPPIFAIPTEGWWSSRVTKRSKAGNG